MLNNRMTNNRQKVRWYNCDRCGFQYPETKVVVFNGLVTCQGPNTCNCKDIAGYRANRKDLKLPIEVPNAPLPTEQEDL